LIEIKRRIKFIIYLHLICEKAAFIFALKKVYLLEEILFERNLLSSRHVYKNYLFAIFLTLANCIHNASRIDSLSP